MSITFACPECRVQIEVGDEFAGLAGQCPRCQQVITIPSPNMPRPAPTVVAAPIPPRDRWADSRDDRPRPPRARTRRPPPPRKPAGPTWPWVVGILGAIVVLLLLFISFIVLVSYRRPLPPRPVIVDMQQGVNFQGGNPQGRVTVGRLDGQRAIMQDGVFQIRSQLNNNDPFDRLQPNARVKRFQIDLNANVNYVLELETNQFDSDFRIENPNNNNVIVARVFGNRWMAGPTTIRYQPPWRRRQNLVVCVTGQNGGVGNFTLTIREPNRPRPNVP